MRQGRQAAPGKASEGRASAALQAVPPTVMQCKIALVGSPCRAQRRRPVETPPLTPSSLHAHNSSCEGLLEEVVAGVSGALLTTTVVTCCCWRPASGPHVTQAAPGEDVEGVARGQRMPPTVMQCQV